MLLPVLGLLLLVQPVQDDSDVPDALRRFVEARKAILRADVAWTQSQPSSRFTHGQPIQLRSFIANSEVAHFIIGTPDRASSQRDDGAPVIGEPWAQLNEAEVSWRYKMDAPAVQRSTRGTQDHPISDFRSVGMSPQLSLGNSPERAAEQALPRGARSIRYSDRVLTDGTHRVEASADDGAAKIVWIIDPKLDWNATRVEYWRGDAVRAQCLTEYERINGVFVPMSSLYLDHNQDIVAHIQVQSIEVNTPDLPSDLTPEFIGVEPGYAVINTDAGGERGPLMYAGDGQFEKSEVVRGKIARGELRLGEHVQGLWDGAGFSQVIPDPKEIRRKIDAQRRQAADRPLDDWEIYTLEFSERYKLDDEQHQKAIQILRQCEARRDHYLRGVHDEMQRELDALTGANGEEKSRHQNRVEELRAPVQKIFDQQLKPRLDKIPTRKQRDLVAAWATAP